MKFSLKKVSMTIAAAGIFGVAGLTLNANANTADAATAGDTATVNWSGDSIQVFAQPSATSKVVNYLPKASSWKVVAVKTVNGKTWYSVGSNQWVDASLMTDGTSVSQAPASSDANIQKVINLAKQQIGKPYVWGAKGPSSFDCSGLMYYVFKNALNRNIGGWTVPQESAGTVISPMNAKAGDLLFWGSRGASYHVALFIGNGQYIHAPQPGQTVTIAKTSAYFFPSFAVRPSY